MSWLRIFAIFGSMVPMGLLTGLSVRDALQPGTNLAANGGIVSVPAAPETLDNLDGAVELELRAVKWLGTGAARPYERWAPPPPLPNDSPWQPFLKDDRPRMELSVELARQWGTAVESTAEVDQAVDDTGLDVPTDTLIQLRDSIEARSTKISQVAPLREVVDTRLARIRELGEKSKLMRTNVDVMRRADLQFKSAQYDACLKVLNEWLGPRTAEVDALETAARYHKEGEPFRARVLDALRPRDGQQCAEPSATWPELIRDIETFLARYPTPPAGALPVLDRGLRLSLKRLNLLIAVDTLTRVPPRNTPQMLTSLNRILAEQPDDTVKSCMANNLRKWIAQGLVVKPVPMREYQYAVNTKSGGLLEGRFTPFSESSYRFWRLERPPNEFAKQFQPLPTQLLEDKPADPPDKAAAQAYEMLREQLLRDAGSLEIWQGFIQQCEIHQERMARYAKLGGRVEVSLASEIAFAKDIVRPDAWSILETLLSR